VPGVECGGRGKPARMELLLAPLHQKKKDPREKWTVNSHDFETFSQQEKNNNGRYYECRYRISQEKGGGVCHLDGGVCRSKHRVAIQPNGGERRLNHPTWYETSPVSVFSHRV